MDKRENEGAASEKPTLFTNPVLFLHFLELQINSCQAAEQLTANTEHLPCQISGGDGSLGAKAQTY